MCRCCSWVVEMCRLGLRWEFPSNAKKGGKIFYILQIIMEIKKETKRVRRIFEHILINQLGLQTKRLGSQVVGVSVVASSGCHSKVTEPYNTLKVIVMQHLLQYLYK